MGNLPEIRLVNWSPLFQWWCVPLDATDDEVLGAVAVAFRAGGMNLPDCLVRDRLYGGFKCSEEGRRHVGFTLGEYSYTDRSNNVPLDAERRRWYWSKLIHESRESGPFVGGGAFIHDAPGET